MLLSNTEITKKVTVQYVAMLKEQAGCAVEVIEVKATNGAELYDYLQKKYHFSIPISQMRVAVNHQFCSMSQTIKDQDLIIFIPPVCGG